MHRDDSTGTTPGQVDQVTGQSPSPGHLEAKTDALRVRLIAEDFGLGLFEESKNGLIYGYTLAVMPAKSKDYGRNAWYLPNWVKDYALAAMPKLGAELAKPKKEQSPLREILALHRDQWRDWLAERDPLKPKRPAKRGSACPGPNIPGPSSKRVYRAFRRFRSVCCHNPNTNNFNLITSFVLVPN
jgi:hypothetical protein